MADNGRKNLVIVESPAKAKTINKYLGDDFVVRASMGHVRDLPSSGMGVDLETFEPEYEVLSSRGKVMSELRKLAKNADTVYLATDLDREGEAIAWHLKEALKLKDERIQRVIFNAITKADIEKAFANPGELDMNRVNAQQARRLLDRVVGYEISPVLWRKVARGLSAGRVQSVAVRLVVEREREIEAFIPDEYWKIGAVFSPKDNAALRDAYATWWDKAAEANEKGDAPTQAAQREWLADNDSFAADMIEWKGEKFEPTDAGATREVAEALGFVVDQVKVVDNEGGKGPQAKLTTLIGKIGTPADFRIRDIQKKRTSSRPSAPFITSTLQQGASSRLSFGASRTMRVAQTLYEAGHITYMRTDSTNLSPAAVGMARDFVGKAFGDNYLPDKPNSYASRNKSAQEAHEAIRVTDVNFTPDMADKKLAVDDAKLYRLIWNRFVACQMVPAQFDNTTVHIEAKTDAGDAVFRTSGRKLVFDGFMRVTGVSSDDQLLPELAEQQQVHPVDLRPSQHFTSPPPRYNEASLVKELEARGIGRPSTYASIIDVIQKREYVLQEGRRFFATLLGKVVTDKLMQAFPEIMDIGFTADMENKLDRIEDEATDWIKLLKDFYGPFHESVDGALEILDHAGGMESPYVDEETGAKLVYRIGKNGFFLAAEDRELNITKPVDPFGKPTIREASGFDCPVCGREMIRRKGRFGEFLGCSGYSEKNEAGEPDCTLIVPINKKTGEPDPPKVEPITTKIACEKCQSDMLLRDSKRGPFLGCSTFPKCRSTKMVKKLEEEQIKYIESLLPELKDRVEKSHELAAKLTDKPADSFGRLPSLVIPREEKKPAKKKTAKKATKKTAKKAAKKTS
ncbi:MAG: type I DNA topoisomerase [Planctomycetota bacterium]